MTNSSRTKKKKRIQRKRILGKSVKFYFDWRQFARTKSISQNQVDKQILFVTNNGITARLADLKKASVYVGKCGSCDVGRNSNNFKSQRRGRSIPADSKYCHNGSILKFFKENAWVNMALFLPRELLRGQMGFSPLYPFGRLGLCGRSAASNSKRRCMSEVRISSLKGQTLLQRPKAKVLLYSNLHVREQTFHIQEAVEDGWGKAPKKKFCDF